VSLRDAYLVDVDQDDLIWVFEVDLVELLVNKGRRLLDYPVPLEGAVVANRWPDRKLHVSGHYLCLFGGQQGANC